MEQTSFSENTTFAIICKTPAAANKLYSALDKKHRECCLLIDEDSTEFHEGIIMPIWQRVWNLTALSFQRLRIRNILPSVTDKYCTLPLQGHCMNWKSCIWERKVNLSRKSSSEFLFFPVTAIIFLWEPSITFLDGSSHNKRHTVE